MKEPKDWLNNFIEKNAWSVLVLIVGMAIFYANINASIQAQARDIRDLETAIADIVQNQKDIIVLQQQDISLSKDIVDIKNSLSDIKQQIGLPR